MNSFHRAFTGDPNAEQRTYKVDMCKEGDTVVDQCPKPIYLILGRRMTIRTTCPLPISTPRDDAFNAPSELKVIQGNALPTSCYHRRSYKIGTFTSIPELSYEFSKLILGGVYSNSLMMASKRMAVRSHRVCGEMIGLNHSHQS